MQIVNMRKDTNGGFIFLEWEEYPASAITFEIFAADDTAVPNWAKIGETSNPFFSDVISFSSSVLLREVFYKIVAKNSAHEVVDEIISNTRPVPNELLKRTLNVLKYSADRAFRNSQWSYKAYLLKQRNAGRKCKCASVDYNSSTRPTCPICYGTGYVGGFFDPIRVHTFPLNETLKQKSINEAVPTGSDTVTFVAPSVPNVNTGDYLVIENVGRYIVMDTTVKALLAHRSPTMLFYASLLQPKDIIYSYPLDTTVPRIDSVTQDARFNFKVTGKNLIPIFGETKLLIWNDARSERCIGRTKDLLKLSEKEAVFKSGLSGALQNFNYRFIINGDIYEGRTVTP